MSVLVDSLGATYDDHPISRAFVCILLRIPCFWCLPMSTFFFLFFYNESAYCFFIIFIQDTYFFNTLLFKYLMILKWWQINEINSNYLPSYLDNCADSCCFTTIFWMMYFSAFFRYIFFPFIYSYAPENKGFLPTGSTNSQVRV